MVAIARAEIRRNVESVRERIASAAARSRRKPEDVTLIGVSKFQPVEAMYAALDCGIAIFGENRVQERAEKAALWKGGEAVWHMIGHLQRNKARRALELFNCIQSVDGFELASALERIISGRSGSEPVISAPYPVFIEVNTSGEGSKSGVQPEGCIALAERIVRDCRSLRIDGFMAIGPLSEEEGETRASFAILRSLAEETRTRTGIEAPHLSMGMSGDFETAIEEGATIVRVGTDIFGARHP
ncbi:MAG: YggS family pyridoxal phosphate-dependent enzyme [Synergistaceae bacterium]|jgi:pyridoxal phosphate enzyme (YggS family)|nr:YggS family pyridoxal phosphate-dependent enzyme [Synergistaceae bacterium]